MLIATLLVAVGVVGAFQVPLAMQRKRYDGYRVLSIVPKTPEAVQLLARLMVTDDETDFWQEPSNVGSEVHLSLSPEHRPKIEKLLIQHGIEFSTHINDIQDQLTPMWNDIELKNLKAGGKKVFNIDDFNTIEDINDWLATLAATCRSGITCQLTNIGNSFEGRPINVFRISSGAGRKGYWIDATIHAREWIATATTLKILNHLVTGGDANAIRLTDTYDWYILPVMNPDGYAFTWSNDRLWRKNRRQNTGSVCFGSDLNRNFNFRWGNDGVSHSPCSDTFCGPNGGSEPETQAVQAELNRLGSTLAATVTVHAYGNMWMFPWGNTVNYAGQTCELAADHNDMMTVAVATANAIQATYNTRWDRGNSCVVIYATTGGTDDYAKGVSGVKYAFCPELRGNSFIIANSNIPLSFNEVWNGIVAMCNSINA